MVELLLLCCLSLAVALHNSRQHILHIHKSLTEVLNVYLHMDTPFSSSGQSLGCVRVQQQPGKLHWDKSCDLLRNTDFTETSQGRVHRLMNWYIICSPRGQS